MDTQKAITLQRECTFRLRLLAIKSTIPKIAALPRSDKNIDSQKRIRILRGHFAVGRNRILLLGMKHQLDSLQK